MLHFDWWSSWGFRNLDQNLSFLTQETGFEEKLVGLFNELKEPQRSMCMIS
jgi:hypothetical protein